MYRSSRKRKDGNAEKSLSGPTISLAQWQLCCMDKTTAVLQKKNYRIKTKDSDIYIFTDPGKQSTKVFTGQGSLPT